jgi:hypothetical protein
MGATMGVVDVTTEGMGWANLEYTSQEIMDPLPI